MGVGVLIAVASALADDCRPAAEAVAEMEGAVLEGRWDDADAAGKRAVASFACGPLADPEVLARMWLAEAVSSSGRGDEASADQAFAAARRVSSATWNDDYGAAFLARWEAAGAAAPETGRLRLEGLPAGVTTAIDGREVATFPAELPSGLHLAQGGAPTAMQDAQVVFLPPGLDLVVRLKLTAAGPAPVSAVPDPAPAPVPDGRPQRKKSPALLVASAVTGLGAAATAGLALAQNGSMRQAEDLAALDGAFRTQQTLGVTSYVLMGATVVGLGLHVAL